MKITGTAVKFGIFSAVLLVFTALIIVVFGQLRFDRTTGYAAVFANAGGLRPGQFVRASGVEVGKVSRVEVIDGGDHARVDFSVDRNVPLYDQTSAAIRYANLIGDRYLEIRRGDSNHRLAAGATIPIERNSPALDLDALIGGFRPLFKALDPEKVNAIASSLLTALQGQGGTISDILDKTAQVTSALADRDQALGEVINNLNTVLTTTVNHQTQFDDTINNFQVLITGLRNQADPLADSAADISNAGGAVADLLSDDRPVLKTTVGKLETLQQPLVDQRDQLDDLLTKVPGALQIAARSGGIYGDFFNFYLCDLSVKLNGLQPGGPVRTVKLVGQPTGRCTPQ